MEPSDWSGPVGTVVSITLAVVSIILAIYFFFRSRQKKKMAYFSYFVQLLGGADDVLPQDVAIFYKGEKIPNLIKANWTIWNSGNQPIRHEDIVPSAPILLALAPNAKILNATIAKVSLPQNGVTVRKHSEREAVLDFIYLEPMQGFVIELLVAMELFGPILNARLAGTIIGMPQGIKRVDLLAEFMKRTIYFVVWFGIGAVVITGALWVMVFPWYLFPLLSHLYVSSYYMVYIISVLLVYCLIFLPLMSVARRRGWTVRDPIPKELGRLRDLLQR